ncbi:hypothetical protein [Rubrivivax gelatinosus]|nr:hypothetical protein [Rubrivivax gelatinosus]
MRDAAAPLEHAIHHRADGDRLDGPLERVQQALQAVLDAIEAGEAQAG